MSCGPACPARRCWPPRRTSKTASSGSRGSFRMRPRPKTMESSGSMSDLIRATATELAGLIAAGEVSAVEVTQAHLDRIAEVDDQVHAFLLVDADGALRAAQAVDAR